MANPSATSTIPRLWGGRLTRLSGFVAARDRDTTSARTTARIAGVLVRIALVRRGWPVAGRPARCASLLAWR
jgi:hypothetical protein